MRSGDFFGADRPDAVTPRRVLVADAIEPEGLMALAGLATVEHRPGISPEELVAAIGGYDALLVRSQTKVTQAVIDAGARLLVVGRAGVGVDNVDVAAATSAGVVVVNAPDGNTIAAAEHTLAMMFALARHIAPADASVKRGEWKRSTYMGMELAGKTLGVLGLGRIGMRVATVAQVLGMDVVAFDPLVSPAAAAAAGVRSASLDDVLATADILTLHLPKTPETTRLLDAAAFAKAKPGVRLVNCARGGVVDELALVDAIRSGRVAGAALDVFEAEPDVREALRALGDRVVLTPHLGASTAEAQLRVASDVAAQVARVLRGEAATTAVALDRPAPARTSAHALVAAR